MIAMKPSRLVMVVRPVWMRSFSILSSRRGDCVGSAGLDQFQALVLRLLFWASRRARSSLEEASSASKTNIPTYCDPLA